eukprot:143275_1
MAVEIEKIDAALGRYYKSLHKKYDHLFLNYCDDNGLDDEALDEEFEQNPDDSMLVDFDEDFPFKNQPQNVPKTIFDILLKCRYNPDISFESKLPEFGQNIFDEINQTHWDKIFKLYQHQCPTMSSLQQGSFIPILAVGRQHKFDYLLHLVDDYTRNRIKHIKQSPWTEKDWSCKNIHKHFQILKDVKVTVPKLMYKTYETQHCFETVTNQIPYNELITYVVKTFGRNCFAKFSFTPMMAINEQLEVIVKYINESIIFVTCLATSDRVVTPFQFDVCIAIATTSISIATTSISKKSCDVIDDDDDDDDIDEDYKSYDYMDVDCIGNIKDKLIKNGLNFILNKNDGMITSNSGIFLNIYREFKMSNKLQDDYIHNKRLIALIDRRMSTRNNGSDDDIWMYEPPCNCQTIPNNAVPEFYMNSSKMCLLPNMKYINSVYSNEITIDYCTSYWSRIYNIMVFKDIQNVVLKFLDEIDKSDKTEEPDHITTLKNSNITTNFHCKGELLTFSFHVKASNVIKCYMYW